MTSPDPQADLPAQYDAGATEHALYQEWETAGVFLALLVLGIVLWFRFSSRIVPMLDALTDR